MSAAKAKPSTPPLSASALDDRFGTPRFIFLGALLLTALVCTAFLNGIKGPYIFDDADSILNNPSIRSFSTALTPPTNNGITVSGRPVLNLSFAINYAISKTEVRGMHLGNILIHALTAIAFFGVVRQTLRQSAFGARFARDATWLAWLIAALWAVHPLQTESVTYTVQRAESLVGLFYLLTLYCFIRYTRARSWGWFAASLASCLLGMGSKEVMATAPLVIFLYDRTFVSGSFRKAWLQHGRLHFGHAVTLILLAGLVLATKSRGGSVGTNDIVTHWSYLCTQTYALVRYSWLSLWPAILTLDYGTLVISNPLTIVSCGLIVIGALAATVWALLRKPTVGFLGAWFFVILAPSSSFIPVNTQTLAEHRVYLSLAAVVIGVVLIAHKLLERRSWILISLLLLPAIAVTIARNHVYLDEFSIWTDTVTKAPQNHRAWANLGTYHLQKEKRPDKALQDFERALAIKPNVPEVLNGLGQTLVKLDRQSEGLALIEKSLLINPTSSALNSGAGAAYMDCGMYERALPLLYKALETDSANSTLNYNIANCLMRLGRDTEAERHFLVAMEGSLGDIDALNNLGTLLRRNGRIDEAISYFLLALKYAPDSAKTHNNIGVAYMSQGKMDDGLHHLREAVRLEPQSYETRVNLCQALTHTNRFDEAIPLCESLLRERPDSELFNNLGALYGQTGQLDKAEAAFRSAIQVDPNNNNARENYDKVRAYLDAHRQR